MSKPLIGLLITDLDNTLYDWVTYFASTFVPFVDEASTLLHVSKERLLDDFREVHRRHQDMEHPFALLETATVQEKMGTLDRQERRRRLERAFVKFNELRKTALHLYPGVEDALQRIKETGCTVVGLTEATVPNAAFRLKFLGLDRFLTRLYAIEPSGAGHPDPARRAAYIRVEQLIRVIPKSARKPNPKVLVAISKEFGADARQMVYVGDSLSKDVGMAKAASVWAVWARYGGRYNQEHWRTLVRVTHWTEKDVEREEEARRAAASIQPDVTIDSFEELSEHFDFVGTSQAAREQGRMSGRGSGAGG